MAFAHLHLHSEFSPLDGLNRLADVVQTIREDGQGAFAITDHGSLGAMWRAQHEADLQGLKFIPGIEAYIAIGSRFERNSLEVAYGADIDDDSAGGKKIKRYYHLTLLARNRAGWDNLVAIQNEGSQHVWGQGKRIDFEFLRDHSDGLICLTGCLSGPVMTHLVAGDVELAAENFDLLQNIFGKMLFAEVMTHGIEEEDAAMPKLVAMAEERGVPLIATNDAHFTREKDKTAHQAWLCLRTKSTLSKPDFTFHGDGYWIRSEGEMRALLPDQQWWQNAVSNAGTLPRLIDERVLPEPQRRLPDAPVPADFDGDGPEYLQHLIRIGLQERFPDGLTDEIRERIRHEWSVIAGMGFVDYFLIVVELLQWAKQHDISTGPGRGSGAGSLCAYALGITHVDPLRHGLLFERFLEPGRAQLPDFDLDFDIERRSEVIEHLIQRYGKNHVAVIGNVMQVRSRQAVQDAARVLENRQLGIALSKAIPLDTDLRNLLADPNGSGAELAKIVQGDTTAKLVIEIALKILDATRGAGVHASGVVVSPVPLTEIIPMRVDKETGRWVTEWDMSAIEEFGLVKIDLLGLRNLTIARMAMEDVNTQHGEELSLYGIPDGDTVGDARVEKTWKMLQSGRTAGVFQLDSSGMTSLVEDITPDSMGDLSAAIALFRPGPLGGGMHTMYVNRKHGREQVSYSHWTRDESEAEQLASALQGTYGVFVFQEDLMRLGTILAGFNDVWRSKLRTAVSKKYADLMEEVHQKLLEDGVREITDDDGAVISPRFAVSTLERLWESMKGSANYLFNKSHSVAYAELSFITAYLKANWPDIYGAAVLRSTDAGSDAGKLKRITAFSALRKEGVEILPPDINVSGARTTAVDGAVRLGLGEIKGVGAFAVAIVAEREESGPFASIEDLMSRVREESNPDKPKAITSDVLIRLIESGALDAFGPRKAMIMMANAWPVMEPDQDIPDFHPVELAARQRTLLLASLGKHPMLSVEEDVEEFVLGKAGVRLNQLLHMENVHDGMVVRVAGILTAAGTRSYANDTKKLLQFSIEDTEGDIAGVFWDGSRQKLETHGVPTIGWPVLVECAVSYRERIDDEGEVQTSMELRGFKMEEIPF